MAHWVRYEATGLKYINADLAVDITFTVPAGMQDPTEVVIEINGKNLPVRDASEVTALYQYVISARKGLVNP